MVAQEGGVGVLKIGQETRYKDRFVPRVCDTTLVLSEALVKILIPSDK